jgi:hypothetical protein
MLWSSSGRGKSEGLRAGFHRAGYNLEVVDTMNRPPEHLAGIALADTYTADPEDAVPYAQLPEAWKHYVRAQAGRQVQGGGLVTARSLGAVNGGLVGMPTADDLKNGAPEFKTYVNEDGEICFSSAPWKELLRVEAPNSVLDLGDLPSAPKMVQLGCNTILLDRRFGTHRIYRTPVVADGNFSASSIQSVMPANTANRMIHWMWEGKDAKAYLEEGMMVEPSRLDLSRLQVMWDDKEYTTYFTKWASAVATYVGDSGMEIFEEDPEDIDGDVRKLAFASPRAYEMMARALTNLDIFGIEAQLPVIQGCIGDVMGTKFHNWITGLRIPSISDIYAGTVDWQAVGNPAAIVAGLHAVSVHCETPEQVHAVFDACEEVEGIYGGAYLVKAIKTLVQRTTNPAHPRHLDSVNCDEINDRGDKIARRLGL